MDLHLWHYLLIAVGINILMFFPAYLFKTDKFTDISYGLSFIIVILIAWILYPYSVTNTLLTAAVVLWGLRLGIFLLVRIHNMKRDRRFDGIRESFWRFLQFWLLQGVTVWIVLIPSLMAMQKDQLRPCYAGLAVWAIGLIIETIADAQKYNFNNTAANKDKFIDHGLWKISRHPNYFGEILCWVGLYVFVFLSFSKSEMLIALIGPIYISFVLLFLTGIPTVEKRADKKWGDDPAYLEYKRRTSILIPWFLKK
jgi:steroid 5-alpha reductase family enzyme